MKKILTTTVLLLTISMTIFAQDDKQAAIDCGQSTFRCNESQKRRAN